MKIPKYIDEALKKRTKAAETFNHYDYIVSRWIVKNGLENDVDTACFLGGVESVVHPDEAEDEVRQAIIQKS